MKTVRKSTGSGSAKAPLRILHFSSHDEDCGIAVYQEQFVLYGRGDGVIQDFFETSPHKSKHFSRSAFQELINRLAKQLLDYDILHIQHEFSFFEGDQLELMIQAAKAQGVKVILTIHTAPEAQLTTVVKLGWRDLAHPRRLRSAWQGRRFNRMIIGNYFSPLIAADRLLVHNQQTQQSLLRLGFEQDNIELLVHPVPLAEAATPEKKPYDLRARFNGPENSVLLATVGFMTEAKGVLEAIQALKFLPDRYKLAILGGLLRGAADDGFFARVTDRVIELGLEDRVFITGFVAEVSDLAQLITQCDICLYPYSKRYYSYVSSGSLNTALAQGVPVISYNCPSFVELNQDLPVVALTKTDNYYDLARAVEQLDVPRAQAAVRGYAKQQAWDVAGLRMIERYRQLLVSEL